MTTLKSRLLMLSCLALVLPLTACDSPEQKEVRFIRRGNVQFEKGEFEKARVEYKNAAQLKPTDAEPLYRLGLIDESMGDLRNAFMAFTAAEQQNKHFHPAILKIAQYFMAAERYDETRRRIESVLGEDANDAEAHALLAALLLREKNLDEAEKEARLALSKDIKNLTAYSALTGLYAAQADYAKADETIAQGLVQNPNNFPLLMLRVVLFDQKKDLDKVAEAYEAIFKLKPKELQHRTNLATLWAADGKMDKAEKVLRDGVTALPDNWEAKGRLVQFIEKNKGAEAAESEIRILMKDFPKNDEPYFWLADLYNRHGDTDKAVQLLEQIISQSKFDADALTAQAQLARLNIKRGNRDMATQLVAAVLKKNPDNRSALLVRANMAFEDGYYQNAVSDLRAILHINPKDADVLRLLGETFLRQGRLDLAIDTLKKQVELNPLDFEARVRLAQIINLNGNPREARDIVTELTKVAPTYAVAWETAARIAIDAKEWLPARAALRELEKIDGQRLTAVFLEGQIQDRAGDNNAAIAKYAEVINTAPQSPLASYALRAIVESYNKENKLDAAVNYLRTVKSDSPQVATLLGKCLLVTGHASEAAEAFDRALAAPKPVEQDPYLGRAELYIKDHNPAAAVDLLKKGAAAFPGDFRAPLFAASTLSETGRLQESIDLYEDLLTRNPTLDVAANNMAALISDFQANNSASLEKARQAAERFINAENPLLLDTIAWVYYRQNNNQMAQTLMERALSRGVTLPPAVHYHYAAILLKNGNAEKAKAELAQALTEGADYPGIEEAKKMAASLR